MKKMFFWTSKILIFLAIIILFSKMTTGFLISEIMFNPEGSDTGREWIEIQFNESDGCINLTQYRLFEEETNHNIYSYDSDIACRYAIICNDVDKFLQEHTYLNKSSNEENSGVGTDTNESISKNISIYRSSFSLGNDGEIIALKHDSGFADYINYTPILALINVPEGYSLELKSGIWQSSENKGGDPGNILYAGNDTENEAHSPENTSENISENENITSNATSNYTSNITANITEEIIENITGNMTWNMTGNLTESNYTGNETENETENDGIEASKCYASIYIQLRNYSTIYENEAAIKFYNKIEIKSIETNSTNNTGNTSSNIEGHNYTIEYWVEDLSGNVVKNRIETSNQNEKSFTPKIDETDKILLIKNSLKYIDCKIINGSSEKMLLVRNSNYIKGNECSCPSCEADSKDSKKSSSSSGSTSGSLSSIQCSTESSQYQTPLVKVINVCNKTGNTSSDTIGTSQSKNTDLESLAIKSASREMNSTNKTQDAGKTTGMIIYESPNLKNRLYALIGLILVGLACAGMILYKVFKR